MDKKILEELFQHIPKNDFHWKDKDKIIFNQIYKAILTEDLHTLNSYSIWMIINENTGETILHIACTLGPSTTVLHLLRRQILNDHEPNVIFLREKYHGFTPLLSAAYAGQSKSFEYILNMILEFLTIKSYNHMHLYEIYSLMDMVEIYYIFVFFQEN